MAGAFQSDAFQTDSFESESGFTGAHGQAQAQIKQVYYVHGQSQSTIVGALNLKYGQAQATITAQYYQLLDTFDNRTFGPVSGSSTSGSLSVDEVNFPDIGKYKGAFLFDDIVGTGSRLEASVDFGSTYLETIVNSSDVTGFFDFFANSYADTDLFIEIYFQNDPTGEMASAYFYGFDDTLYFADFLGDQAFVPIGALEDGEAYRYMMHMANGRIRIKLWKLSDPEPTDYVIDIDYPSFFALEAGFGISWSNNATSVWMDNLTVLVPQVPISQNHGLAQAFMLGVTSKHGQARPRIKRTDNTRSGQARAFIRFRGVHGQARARIALVRSALGQAQASIFNPGKAYGQAQAYIHKPETHGQAQARIQTTNIYSAQAQARIRQAWEKHAQSQAVIKFVGNYSLGQAQAYIRLNVPSGQAHAYIANGQEYLILDRADRVTTLGTLGTPNIGPAYTVTHLEGFPEFFTTHYDESYVDGEVILTTGVEDYDWINTHSPVHTRNTEMYVDLWFSALNDWSTIFDYNFRATAFGAGYGWSLYYDPDLDQMVLYNYQTNGSLGDTLFAPLVANTWYSIHISSQENDIKFKIWESADPEPGTWLAEDTITNFVYDAGAIELYTDVGENIVVPTYVKYDNFRVIGVNTYVAAYGQAQALIARTQKPGQAQGYIKTTERAYGQAQAYVYGFVYQSYGQAQARIKSSPRRSGQALAYIIKPLPHGQAQAYINNTSVYKHGQAVAYVGKQYFAHGLARAYIIKPQAFGQAQARIGGYGWKLGNAQAFIRRTDARRAYGQAAAMLRMPATGQAQALINAPGYLKRFNNYDLPGYIQQESLNSIERLLGYEASYVDASFTEYEGLQNKLIPIAMKVVGPTYADVKLQARRASTMLRSSQGYAKFYLQKYDRYLLAQTQKVNIGKAVGESMRFIEYAVELEAKPWLISDAQYTLSGVSTITTTGRMYSEGGWTPARIVIDGTDVTISGYSVTGDFAGYLAVSGLVQGLIINSDDYTATMNGENANRYMITPDYKMYVAPGVTTYDIEGATKVEITYHNRWYL